MRKMNLFSKPFFYVAAAVYILAGFSTLVAGDRLAGMLFSEDKYFENMGALGFFAASIVFAYGFIKTIKAPSHTIFFRFRQLILLGFALLFFFGGGEEVSWGQRIFNVKTPEDLAEINTQGEINVHNIDVFEHKIRFEVLFDLFWFSLTVLLPLVAMFTKPLREFFEKLLPIPHLGIGCLFLFNYLSAKSSELIYQKMYTYSRVPFIQAVQEVKESAYALLFVFVAIYIVQETMSVLTQLKSQNAEKV